MNDISIDKSLALQEEFETAHKLILLGFGELQSINLSNNFYFLPLQLLSQGIERLFKAYICVAYYTNRSRLPSCQELKQLGHDLIKLFDVIKGDYFIKYSAPIFEDDEAFLTDSLILREILDILSDFGKQARYYNFDLITCNPKLGKNPKERWRELEEYIQPYDKQLMERLLNTDLDKEIFPEINRTIIICCEKLITCLARQISFGTLGLLGKQLSSSNIFKFVIMNENKYGTTDYRKATTTYKQTVLLRHKRTFVDYLNRKFNKNYKHKIITKSDFAGDWPFYAEKIVIECRYKHWCLVTIDGYDYALNGAAKGRYKLDLPHDAGVAILGKSIGDLIQMALSL